MGWAREGVSSGALNAGGSRSSTPNPLPDCVNCEDLGTPKSTTLTLHWLNAPRTALVVCKLSASLVPSLNAALRWLRCVCVCVCVCVGMFVLVCLKLCDGGVQSQC